jgi:peptide/nickel transport system substrate-binding protein
MTMTRIRHVILATMVSGLVLSACSSSSNITGATPMRGGTLTMLGTGDVDTMDPNVSYYPTGYLALRMWSRQLLTYPAVPGQTTTVVADLAAQVPSTSNGGISADGRTYKLTIRSGAVWNTTPPRQVVAGDVVRGLERTCNPAEPFGGLPDFETLISGMERFCTAFAKVAPTAMAIGAFIDTHSISGVSVDPSNPLTIVFTLNHPATYFADLLAMPAFSPAPVEFLNYVPASAALAQHTISDGPYMIQSYVPTRSIVFVRNPDWKPSTDPVRRAYVDKIEVSETGNGQGIQQELETNSPSADMGWDTPVPAPDIPGLVTAKNRNLTLGPSFGTEYVLFNTVSPNNHDALSQLRVRQALEYAIDPAYLIQDEGGPAASPPLTHILPPGIVGSQPPTKPYSYQPQKAKQLLAEAVPNGHLNLTILYEPAIGLEVNVYQTLQDDLAQVGITVKGIGTPNADFGTDYLEVPSVAHRGVWDLALTAWAPDWYGNSALSFFGPPSYPPDGANYGFYNDPKVDQLIQEASTTTTTSRAAALWAQADTLVMADAAIFPFASPNLPVYHAAQVHNAVYLPYLSQFDPTNVWLTPSLNGGH